jgi:hypothetical protein
MRRPSLFATLTLLGAGAVTMPAQQPPNKETTKLILQVDMPSAIGRTLAISRDGSRAAYVVQRGKKVAVLVNGTEGKPYDAIGAPGPVFSPDGRQMAYAAKVGKKWVAVVDGAEGAPFEGVGVPIFSPDSRRFAYTAELNKKRLVVVNGTNGKPYDGIAGIVFSPDGSHLAYSAQSGGKWMVVADGVEGKPYDGIVEPGILFSDDGRRMAYIADAGKKRLVVDGVEGKACDGIGKEGQFFSPDGQHIAYGAKAGEKWMVVVDGAEGKPYDLIGQDGPVFSPDSRRLAYVGETAKKRVVVVDGVESKSYDGASNPVFSPDSRRLAYIAGLGGKMLVVVDGVEGKLYDSVGNKGLTFSPDSRRVAYVAGIGDRWAVVLDGIEDKPYAGIGGPGLLFSPDSRHLAYIADLGVMKAFVVDGGEGKHYDSFLSSKIGFDSPDSYHYVVGKQHDANMDVLLVEGNIPACVDAACSTTESAMSAQTGEESPQSSPAAAIAPAPQPQTGSTRPAPLRTAKVILIAPQVRLEDMVTGRVLNPAQFRSATQHSTYESRLLDAARSKITPKASVLEAEAMGEPVAESGSNLQALSSRLAHGYVTDEAKQEFARLAALNEQQLILVQFIRVKVGPRGYWDPNTGAIGSAARSTLVQAALISCRSGQVIWKGEQFVRKALDPDSDELGKTVSLLYETLDIP